MKHVLSIEEQRENLTRELNESIRRWHDIFKNGCSDPFWPDGVNLNLVRNHIIYFLGELNKIEKTTEQISMFCIGAGIADLESDERIPMKVPDNYMANERRCRRFEYSDEKPIYRESFIQKSG